MSRFKIQPAEAPPVLYERNVHSVVAAIREKELWWDKYQTPEIFEKWKQEVAEDYRQNPDGYTKYQEMLERIDQVFEFVYQELAYFDELRAATAPFSPGPSERVYMADEVVDQGTKAKLQQLVRGHLENVPEGQIDWHPGSGKQVRDLVHPSLYCLEYGYTLVRDRETDQLMAAKKGEKSRARTSKYQWLPSVFQVTYDEDQKKYQVSIDSYINNLHPVYHQELYPLVARVFETAIPALNRVLHNAAKPFPRRAKEIDMLDLYTREHYDALETDEDLYEEMMTHRQDYLKPLDLGWAAPTPETTIEDHRLPIKPGDSLKVITKLANIELTPESPTCNGGKWHIEGSLNEGIVATVLYYYDSENITESRLAFREQWDDMKLPYEQGDDPGVFFVYGVENEGSLVAPVGSVKCQQDRLLVFPNMYQHRVQPFELADKTKPGHRKILCFFLCDEVNTYGDPVYSTADVPYQNQTWVRDEMAHTKLPTRLPQELFDMVVDETHTMSWEYAKDLRDKLMAERTNDFYTGDFDEELVFSLCEH